MQDKAERIIGEETGDQIHLSIENGFELRAVRNYCLARERDAQTSQKQYDEFLFKFLPQLRDFYYTIDFELGIITLGDRKCLK